MLLYHYSSRLHDRLESRRVQGISLPKDVHVSDDYLDQISFFFDPIPSKLLPDIFTKGHPVWYRGHELYEYVIDVDKDLEEELNYRVVESFQRTKLLDEFSLKHDWVKDNSATLALWNKLEFQKQKEWGELGWSRTDLKKQIKLNHGVTKLGYLAAFNRDDFQDGYNKYAANVPHVMLYTRTGVITPEQVNKLKIGDDRRTKVR